ncbi:putative surface protein with fasciclin (FAS1) repeats [Kineococcus xinjiangensis]|uniref:Putative surface protein with fasciclin (FAS1) repeats n=1 Tax=Kineococcus xinjiangensis TaxID=512762 RepID=A0A2S6ICR5_9ACTN|nr:fasciclin domain-containing protein [Kineococcus xinjiangensis]PPK91991.1 putative surface protein with fasciclin (FAS1) repeats [Kineococcus xinjiangensis]
MKRSATLLALVASVTLGLSACGDAETTAPANAPSELSSPSSSSSAPAETPSETPSESPSSEATEMASGPVGPGCAAYAEANSSGPASVEGMAMDPVATAASNNPMLTTLTAAVSGKLNPKVDLVSTLNGDQFTVFAPVDEAFGKIDPATIETLKTDDALLSTILTYHVVPGQIGVDEIVGTHETVQGGTVEVSGTPENLTVNGNSAVICGGVKTANATVYLVDSVLMPTM